MTFIETLRERARRIDERLGPLSGYDADEMARLLREAANCIEALTAQKVD